MAVALLGGAGEADRPGSHHPGGDTRMRLISLWLNLERTLDKRRRKVGVVARRRQQKKVITWQRAMTKKGCPSVLGKNRLSVLKGKKIGGEGELTVLLNFRSALSSRITKILTRYFTNLPNVPCMC